VSITYSICLMPLPGTKTGGGGTLNYGPGKPNGGLITAYFSIPLYALLIDSLSTRSAASTHSSFKVF